MAAEGQDAVGRDAVGRDSVGRDAVGRISNPSTKGQDSVGRISNPSTKGQDSVGRISNPSIIPVVSLAAPAPAPEFRRDQISMAAVHGFQLVAAVASEPRVWSLEELSARVTCSPDRAERILNSAVQEGWVARSGSGYLIGDNCFSAFSKMRNYYNNMIQLFHRTINRELADE